MKECSWKEIARLPSAGAEREGAAAVDDSCPCVCLQHMTSVLERASLEEALIQVQGCLRGVMGTVLLSLYRRSPGEDDCCLVATSYTPDEALLRARLPLAASSMAAAVLQDGVIRWAAPAGPGGTVVAMVPVGGQGTTDSLLVVEFPGEGTGCGKRSAVCLRCAAAVLYVVSLRTQMARSGDRRSQLVRCRAVTELTVQVTHDINNMMQGVLGNAVLARMDLPADSPAVEALASVEEAAKRASVLARKLLNMARDDAAGSVNCDAVRVASDTLDLAALLYLKGVPIKRSLPSSAVLVRMRENDLQTALIACIKAGLLCLSPVMEVSLSLTGGTARTTLSLRLQGVQQGSGASDRLQELTTTARACLSCCGGTLDLTEQPGVSAATMTIPLQLQEQPGRIPISNPSPRLDGLRLLVVEAAPSPLLLVLRTAGCVVQSAASWEEAARLVRAGGISAVIAAAGSEAELRAAAEGRHLLGLPVIAACLISLPCPPEVAGSLDGILGLPLDLDHLRQLLVRVLR